MLQRSRVWQHGKAASLVYIGRLLEIRRGRVRKAASFTCEGSRTATVCFGESVEFLKKTYLNDDLWLWRVLLPSGSDVLDGFMRSPESAHFSWRQEAKADVCGCSAALKNIYISHTIHAAPWRCGAHLMAKPASVTYMNNFSLQLKPCLRAPAARLLLDHWTIYWLFPNKYEDNAEHSTDMQRIH